MSRASRDKGLAGEREVAAIFAGAGYSVRNLEGQGDALAIGADGALLHVETKRQERMRLPEWLRQAQAEAPEGATPVVCFRQSRGEWYACVRLADLVELAR